MRRGSAVAALAVAMLAVGTPARADVYLTPDRARWDGCTITYSMHRASAVPPKALRQAVGDIRQVSGVTFQWVRRGGQVTVRRDSRRAVFAVADATPVVEWPAGAPGPRIIGGLVRAYHVGDYPFAVRRMTWEHELGHILGLGHLPGGDPTEVMSEWVNSARRSPAFTAALTALYPECLAAPAVTP